MPITVSKKTKQITTSSGLQVTISTFSARQRAAFLDQSVYVDGESNATPRTGSMMLAAVALGVEGWSGLMNPADESKEVKPRFVNRNGVRSLADVSLDAIADDIQEIGTLVLEFNSLTESDAGKSGTSSDTPPVN